MISVISTHGCSTHGCCGFVVPRRHQFQAYAADCRSLGTFETQQAAIDCVLRAAETDHAA